MTRLSQRLRTLADIVEDSEIDDDRNAHLSFRMDEDESRHTELPIGQTDDPYEGNVLATIFTEDLE